MQREDREGREGSDAVVSGKDRDFGIDRPGRAHNVGIEGAGVRPHGAVLHAEAAVERERGFLADAGAEPCGADVTACASDGVCDPFGEKRGIVDLRGDLVPFAHELGHLSVEEGAGMAVRGRDADPGRRDPAPPFRFLAGVRRDHGRDADQIAENQRRDGRSLLEDHHLGLQRILRAGIRAIVIIARHRVAFGRRDVDFRDADAEPGVPGTAGGGAAGGQEQPEEVLHFSTTRWSAFTAPSTSFWPPSGASLLDRAVRGS